MLLQALFAISISAGFSHTGLRQPCASAACQQLELRSCASADKRRFVGRRLGGRAAQTARPFLAPARGTVCSATTSGPTFSPWAVKLIGKLSDEAHSRDGKRIWLGPGGAGAQRRRAQRRVLAVLGLLLSSFVFANRLAVEAPLNPTAAAVLPLANMASTATTAFFNAAGGCVPVAFLVCGWAVNSKLDGLMDMESLHRDVKRQANTELGTDQTSHRRWTRRTLIRQRGLLNDVTVDLQRCVAEHRQCPLEGVEEGVKQDPERVAHDGLAMRVLAAVGARLEDGDPVLPHDRHLERPDAGRDQQQHEQADDEDDVQEGEHV